MNFKQLFLILGSIYTVILFILVDPQLGLLEHLPVGKVTILELTRLFTVNIYIAFLYLGIKAFIEYVDLQAFFKRALSSSEGAGLAIIGVGLITVAIAIVIASVVM